MSTAKRRASPPPRRPTASLPAPLPQRVASAWLGRVAADVPELEPRWSALDHAARAALAKWTGGLSPVSALAAYTDWALHLALAPGKQAQLFEKAGKKTQRLLAFAAAASAAKGGAMGGAMGGAIGDAPCAPCIEPLPQDKRFNDPAWQAWPFNVMAQSFLLTQQWWHVATTGVAGVTPHHEDMVNFAARQWLDRFAPSNFITTNPVVLAETARSGGANLWRGWLNAMDDAQRQLSGRPPAGAEAFVVGQNLASTPGQVVLKNRLIELIQYAPSTPKVHAEPVLLVPAWIMKYYILDLSAHNSLVCYLVEKGHTVFTLSWKNPQPADDPSDAELSMDDYRQLGVMAALDAVTTLCAGAKVHLVGYCLGGTLAAIAAAQMARDGDARLASLTLLAAQTDFEEPGEISLFIDDSQVSFLEDLMRRHGVLEGTQMAGMFQLLRSNDLIWSYRLQNHLLGQRQRVSDLMAWNADATRLPLRMHSQYLRQLFLKNELAQGRYMVGATPVSLGDVHLPLFALGTVADHVAPWRSVFKIQRLCDTDCLFLLTSGGHNAGIVNPPGPAGRSYQWRLHGQGENAIDPDAWLAAAERVEGSWWPAWQAWLASHSGRLQRPPPLGCTAHPAQGPAPGQYVHGR
jgi:polyhydroxyalkanoate synthase subunit PhaC